MPKSRIILGLGFLIALLPVLGFPHAWESFFQVATGLGIVLLSVLIAVDKRLSLKAKAERRHAKRKAELENEQTSSDSPLAYGRRVTDITPERRKVVRLGRRATDITVENETQVTPEGDNVAVHE